MAGLLGQIRNLNGLGATSLAEPFAGGAGASLSLLYLEEAQEIFINDADPAIYAFWWAVTNRPTAFAEMLGRARVGMAEWRRQRTTYRLGKRVSRIRRGFSAFYLNRCNRSGIIMNGGPIGGIEQSGAWKIGARYNKSELRKRCEKVATYRERIHVSNDDGLDFIKNLEAKSTMFFIDPPYFEKGPTLYMNVLSAKYHASLASTLRKMQDDAWVLTYDDCREVRQLYRGWANIRPFSLRYVAAGRRTGKEILITPRWLRLPRHQESAAITW